MSKAKTSGSTKDAKTNASNSVRSNENPAADLDNPSKFQPTEEADLDAVALDAEDGLQKLFLDSLKDLYWAENHLIKALPKMINAASLPALQEALSNHLEETKGHVERLNQVFQLLGEEPQAKKCDAMEGLTKEGEGCIESTDAGTPARNLAIILSSQKVEHYEISSYTGLIGLAVKLGQEEAADLLELTLEEEESSDELLAEIAENEIVPGELPGEESED